MSSEAHLILQPVLLRPGGEWLARNPAWRLLQVEQGVGYWISASHNQHVGAGDVLLLSPSANGTVRASLLGEMKLRYFTVSVETLSSLLTLPERQSLEKLAGSALGAFRHFPAAHAAAGHFTRLETEGAWEFVARCRMLELFGSVLPAELVPPRTDAPHIVRLQDRIRQLFHQMTEMEILTRTPEELARVCGCSLRHFRRLFRTHFGCSIRDKQTALRLEKARVLLQTTDDKIINIALECGYRSLGLFNYMFKKNFSMTPGGWREQSQKKNVTRRIGRAAALLLAGGLALWGARGQSTNPAPSAAVSTNPPAATNAAPERKFEVRGYQVTGNTVLPAEMVDKIFADYTGSEVTLDRIRAALAELNLAYRGRGFVTVSVTLPPQQLTNGIVNVKVTEGRLSAVTIVNNRWHSSNNVMRALPSLRTNALLNSLVFQQDLDRANASRDRQIYPQLGPGPDPGTTALELRVKDRLPLHAHLEWNNYATPGTPDYRLNTSAQYNNLWQLDHQVGISYSFTPSDMKSENQLPWHFYEQPLFSTISMFYRMPLKLGEELKDYTIDQFGYDEVTKRFRPPPAINPSELIVYASRSYVDSGLLDGINFSTNYGSGVFTDQTFQKNFTVNENLGFRVTHTLPAIAKFRSVVNFGVDFKAYRLRHYETNQISDVTFPPPPPAVPLPPVTVANAVPAIQPANTIVNYLPISLGWDAVRMDKWGSTAFGFNGSFNIAGLLGDARDFQRASYTPAAKGTYGVVTMNFTREQRLYKEWTLRLHADGQWASQPLLSNEQFGLGGNAGVRGYQDGADYGDTGWRVQVEPRTPAYNWGMVDGTQPMFWRAFTFLDYGERYLLAAAGKPPTERLCGTGFGFIGNVGSHFDVRLQCGWVLRTLPFAAAGESRVAFSLAWQF